MSYFMDWFWLALGLPDALPWKATRGEIPRWEDEMLVLSVCVFHGKGSPGRFRAILLWPAEPENPLCGRWTSQYTHSSRRRSFVGVEQSSTRFRTTSSWLLLSLSVHSTTVRHHGSKTMTVGLRMSVNCEQYNDITLRTSQDSRSALTLAVWRVMTSTPISWSPSLTRLIYALPSQVHHSQHLYTTSIAVSVVEVEIKGKLLPYSLPSVGPGADPGVQAICPQVTFQVMSSQR